MTITANVLTGGTTNSSGSTYTTGSVTPTANKLLLLYLAPEQSSTIIANPTVTGCGLTWVQVCATSNANSGAQNALIYRAMGSAPTAGAITIHDAGTTYQRIIWTLVEYSGADTSGTNGSGAIVQTATLNLPGGASSISQTFGTTVTAGNSTSGVISVNSGSQTFTPGAGYVALDTENIGITQGEVVLFASAAQQTISASFSGTANGTLAAVELKAAASSSIGETLLTSGNSTTDGTTFTTASITPAANSQVFAAVMTQPSGTPSNPTVSGCNLTWTLIAQQPQGSGNFQRTITVYRGTSAAPTTGPLTFTDTATDTQCCWSVVQLTNLDPVTPVTQVITGQLASVTTGSISFGSTVDPSDTTLAWIGYSNAGVLTAGTGWTSIDQQETTNSAQTMMTEYAATPQNAVSATLPASGNMFIVAIEANLVNGPQSTHTFEYGSFDVNLQFGTSQASQAMSGAVSVWSLTQQTPAPNAPTIGVATAGIQSATVGFTPASTGAAATSYTVTSSPGGITATGTSSPIAVAGLTAGQSYTFTVYATNATGNSASSAASNSVTPTAPVTASTLFGVSSSTISEQNTNYPLYGPSPVCWRIYSTQSSGATLNPPSITFRAGDSIAFSTTRYNSPGPSVSSMVTLFNGQPVGRKFLYIPFHEPEDNIAGGTLTLSNYLALFPAAMTAKQECSHPQDILICVVLQGETYHNGSNRNPETYLPDDTNFDVMGTDSYFGGTIGTAVTTIPGSFDACISLAAAHGNKLWGVFETGVGTTNISEQTRLNSLQTLSQTIADKKALNGCYFVGSGNNQWVLNSSEVSFWKAGQSG